jgi:amino acid transporter
MSESKTFVRRASGLVRQVSALDVLIYNIGLISVGYVLFMFLFWVSYPGASLEVGVLISTVLALFQGLTYALLASAYPRSGADYVYVSRILHPSLGFAMSWNWWIWFIFSTGLNAWTVALWGASPFLGGIGLLTNNPNLVAMGSWAGSPNGLFCVGGIGIVVMTVLLISGNKNYFLYQKIFFAIAILSTLIVIGLLATSDHTSFVTRFNALAQPYSNSTDTYHSILGAATQSGFGASSPYSLLQTVYFFVWPWFGIGYCFLSASFSGEVKGVKKSQLIGMLGSVVVAGILFFLLAWLGGEVFGYDFIGAIGYLLLNNPSALPIPVTPWFNLLSAILTNNVAVSAFILLGWLAWFILVMGTSFLYTTRVALAWGIDNMFPRAFAYVHPRFRTPVTTIIVGGIGSLIFLAGLSYTTYLGVLSGTIGFGIAIVVTSIAAIVFPYVRSDLYKRSGINWELAGIPVISIAGTVNMITNLVILYIILTDARAGANSPSSMMIVAAIFVTGFILFYAIRAIRKKQGIDVDLLFKEVPIE